VLVFGGQALPGLIDYCGVWDCPALSNSAGSEGIHNVTADPLFMDYAGHDYSIPAASPYRDAGTACVATVDPIGTVIPQGISPDIGAYEYQQRPSVISGAGQGLAVDVRLDLAIDPATVGAPGDWTVEPLFAGGHVAVTDVAYTPDSLQVVLNLSEALTSVEAYRVTAPATIATDSGALIDNRTADFVAPRYIEPESSGILNCTLDGEIIETGEPKFELIPWGAEVPGTDLMQLVYISLFTDARLDKSEVMSSDTRDLGGWWADAFTGVAPIGSKLHRLFRVLPTATNIQQAQIHCLMALDWMVQDRLIAKAEVEIKRTGLGAASGKVTLYERDGNKIVREWADFWKMLR
jgi:phage gp46-like protein